MASQSPRSLAALMGSAAAAGVLLTTLAQFEGKRNVAYRDIAGIPTVCYGDTQDVIAGRRYTDAECDARLEKQAATHVAGVLQCTKILASHPRILIAAGSLAYNIGVANYCRSTAARRFSAGDFARGCDAILMWNKVGTRVVPGLARRRQAERRICLSGVPA